MNNRPAVFLDRDGTLIEEAGYLDRLERLVFFPYAVDAVRLLNRSGLAGVVGPTQAGGARRIFKEPFVAAPPPTLPAVRPANRAPGSGRLPPSPVVPDVCPSR